MKVADSSQWHVMAPSRTRIMLGLTDVVTGFDLLYLEAVVLGALVNQSASWLCSRSISSLELQLLRHSTSVLPPVSATTRQHRAQCLYHWICLINCSHYYARVQAQLVIAAGYNWNALKTMTLENTVAGEPQQWSLGESPDNRKDVSSCRKPAKTLPPSPSPGTRKPWASQACAVVDHFPLFLWKCITVKTMELHQFPRLEYFSCSTLK